MIPDDEEVIDTTNRGEPVVLVPDSRLGEIYEKIARRLEGEKVPFTVLTAPGLFGRLFGQRKAG
jgi:septum site-determining protein MinD